MSAAHISDFSDFSDSDDEHKKTKNKLINKNEPEDKTPNKHTFNMTSILSNSSKLNKSKGDPDELKIVIKNTIKTIKKMTFTADFIVNSTIMLFAPPKCGKTVAILDLMYIIKDRIPNILVICPTNDTGHNSYTGLVPDECIHDVMGENGIQNKESIIKFVGKIIERQNNVTALYKSTLNLDDLINISKSIDDKDLINEIKIIKNNDINGIKEMKRLLDSKTITDEMYEKEKYKINKITEKDYIKTYKKYISKHRKLLKTKIIDPEYLNIINYIDINPELLLIFDDCASTIKSCLTIDAIKKLFYQNRHFNTTVIFAFQSLSDCNKNLRDVAKITIFCEPNTFTNNIHMKGIKKDQAIYWSECAKKIFEVKYRQLICSQEYAQCPNGDEIYYNTFAEHAKFRAASEYVFKLCKSVSNNGRCKIDAESEFSKYINTG